MPCDAMVQDYRANYIAYCYYKIDGGHDEYRFGIPFLEQFTTTYVY